MLYASYISVLFFCPALRGRVNNIKNRPFVASPVCSGRLSARYSSALFCSADRLLWVAAASAPQPGRPANPCLETVLRAAGENTLIQQDPFRYLLSEAGEPFPRTPGSRTSAPRLWNK